MIRSTTHTMQAMRKKLTLLNMVLSSISGANAFDHIDIDAHGRG